MEGRLEDAIRTIPDFPKPGIQFKDINPLFADPAAYKEAIDRISKLYEPSTYDRIGAFDARGFLFGAAMSYATGKPLFLLRKKGKLPYETVVQEYALEYGTAALEAQSDAVRRGERVLLVDDVLATGGTMRAGCDLVERLGGTITGCATLIELDGLGGRERLSGYDTKSILRYG